MADISKIKLPNDNTTYNVKDAAAVTEIQINGTAQTKTNGVVNLPAYPTTLPASDTTSTYSSSGTAPVNGVAVNAAIGTLDVSSKGGSGKYISAISETNGKISATATTMDTTPTSASTNAITSGGVYTALADKADKDATSIPSGADLDNYIDDGAYKSASSTITNSLYHCPTSGTGFVLYVKNFSIHGSTQVIFISGTTGASIYIRNKNSTGWMDWFVFKTSTVAPSVHVPDSQNSVSPTLQMQQIGSDELTLDEPNEQEEI